MTRRLPPLMLAVVLVVVVAGCGGGPNRTACTKGNAREIGLEAFSAAHVINRRLTAFEVTAVRVDRGTAAVEVHLDDWGFVTALLACRQGQGWRVTDVREDGA
jgi:hypothetical protein